MKSRLVDFHCHLDLYPDLVAAIADAEAAGVYTLTVTTTPKAWPRNLELTRGTTRVRAALGLHPQVVSERSGEISLWETYLPEARYVGEVGLDAAPRYYRSFDLQQQIFERILKQCAKAGGKILTIHSVRAAAVVLDLIEAHLPPGRGQKVLHWFTGTKADARRAVDLGCYFSVNARMLETDRGRDLIGILPNERLLTETDGPFTKFGGRPACPADVADTVLGLAKLHQLSLDEMTATINKNLTTIVSSAGES
ncbi:MAG: TatD family hydrolase [Verrucomicrobia bacterium]|nr:TatD family hydrolase [Verrucomicrobiota bacterium]